MQPNMQAPQRSLNLGQARRLPGPTRGGSPVRRPSVRPSLPPKGWCWHRGAKLAPYLVDDKQLAVWYCSTCQNATGLVHDRAE
jgi:hypothetical protein